MEPKGDSQRRITVPTVLYKATCLIAGCDTGEGAPYETPAFTGPLGQEQAARDIGDHITSEHTVALVQQVTVDPEYPA